MAYTVAWSPVFALRLIAHVDVLQEQREIGRVVPERRQRHIREIIFRPYRIVYRVDHDDRRIEIARVWHAARGTPEFRRSNLETR